jgi:hypothetical protein
MTDVIRYVAVLYVSLLAILTLVAFIKLNTKKRPRFGGKPRARARAPSLPRA